VVPRLDDVSHGPSLAEAATELDAPSWADDALDGADLQVFRFGLALDPGGVDRKVARSHGGQR